MIRTVLIAVTGFSLLAGASQAADIRALTTGAIKPVVLAIQPEFEAKTGDHLIIQNDTAGAVVKRITAGEAYDVVISNKNGLASLVKDGKVLPASATDLARVNISVAVKTGAPTPDISTVAAFKATLLKAKSVAYIDPASGGSSGVYLAGLFERMGIADAIKAKAVLSYGGFSAEFLLDGKAEIALQQTSEFLAFKGITVVGPIPEELQNYTAYSGGVTSASKVAGEAQKLLNALKAPENASVLASKGLLAP